MSLIKYKNEFIMYGMGQQMWENFEEDKTMLNVYMKCHILFGLYINYLNFRI